MHKGEGVGHQERLCGVLTTVNVLRATHNTRQLDHHARPAHSTAAWGGNTEACTYVQQRADGGSVWDTPKLRHQCRQRRNHVAGGSAGEHGCDLATTRQVLRCARQRHRRPSGGHIRRYRVAIAPRHGQQPRCQTKGPQRGRIKPQDGGRGRRGRLNARRGCRHAGYWAPRSSVDCGRCSRCGLQCWRRTPCRWHRTRRGSGRGGRGTATRRGTAALNGGLVLLLRRKRRRWL